MTTELIGTVLAVQANFYRVSLEGTAEELLCIRRARLKKTNQHIYVGDRVYVEEPDWQGKRGAIAAIEERHSLLERPKIANIDRVLLVFALADPDIDPYQLSRFLVSIEASHLQVSLALNKCDLVTGSEQQMWCDRINSWGYQSLPISTHSHNQTSNGIEALRQTFTPGITAISGPSGVGKSSLINALIPDADLRTSAVSQKLGHGRHTTRHVELFDLGDRCLLADSPGFMQPALQCEPQELAFYFPEARQRLSENPCQFSDCLHHDEPGCAVRGDWERYEHYLLFLEEVMAYDEKLRMTSTPDNVLKLKTATGGRQQAEPRLKTKRDRRTSRRTKQQKFHSDYNEELSSLEDPSTDTNEVVE